MIVEIVLTSEHPSGTWDCRFGAFLLDYVTTFVLYFVLCILKYLFLCQKYPLFILILPVVSNTDFYSEGVVRLKQVSVLTSDPSVSCDKASCCLFCEKSHMETNISAGHKLTAKVLSGYNSDFIRDDAKDVQIAFLDSQNVILSSFNVGSAS